MEKQFLEEKEYWRNILKRILAAVKFLSKNGLALYGSTTKLFANGNGNFLSSIEFLSEFDPLLSTHLQKYGNPGSGNVSYLSSTVCSEFIDLLTNEVQSFILEEIRTAKYFSIIIDSTPDISHIDQLTIIIRYVLPSGQPVERFLGFVPIFSHTADNIANVVLEKLNKFNIDINYCRGQSYDNASNMSGKYNRLQAKIKSKSENAHFVPCSSHSLNLVGNSAAESCLEAATYFDYVQCVYNFFSSSTYRWNLLQNMFGKANKKLNVKKICDTRWSTRADAVKTMAFGLNEIRDALNYLHEDSYQKKSTRVEAKDILLKTDSFEFSLMTVIWHKILQRINETSKSLQNTQGNLAVACKLYSSLISFIEHLREKFEEIETEAKILHPHNTLYKDEITRIRKRKAHFDEGSAEDISFVGSEKFKITIFFVICDKLITELLLRKEAYKSTNDIFNILFVDCKNELCKISLKNVEKYYCQDVDISNLEDEIIQFKGLCLSNKSSNTTDNPESMLEFLIETNTMSTFPNVETLLRIYLTIPISNASGERSFSTLKRVKTYLRNSLNQEHTSSLSLLYVESDILQTIECDKIIDNFAEMKLRKKKL